MLISSIVLSFGLHKPPYELTGFNTLNPEHGNT